MDIEKSENSVGDLRIYISTHSRKSKQKLAKLCVHWGVKDTTKLVQKT